MQTTRQVRYRTWIWILVSKFIWLASSASKNTCFFAILKGRRTCLFQSHQNWWQRATGMKSSCWHWDTLPPGGSIPKVLEGGEMGGAGATVKGNNQYLTHAQDTLRRWHSENRSHHLPPPGRRGHTARCLLVPGRFDLGFLGTFFLFFFFLNKFNWLNLTTINKPSTINWVQNFMGTARSLYSFNQLYEPHIPSLTVECVHFKLPLSDHLSSQSVSWNPAFYAHHLIHLL